MTYTGSALLDQLVAEAAIRRKIFFTPRNKLSPPPSNPMPKIRGTGRITTRDIQRVVAWYYGVTTEEISGRCRKETLVRPRQVGMYLSRILTRQSFPQIGLVFCREQSIVCTSARKISDLLSGAHVKYLPRAFDITLANEIEDLRKILS